MQLQINGLCKRYPNGVQALDNVSLTIPEGMFGLLGPNGAGKSTLMRIIATLQEADAGTVSLDNLNVLQDKPAVRKQLGYLPQEFGLYPKVSAWDLLNHFAVLKGVGPASHRKEVCKALLQKTNLFEVRHQRLGGYSGGMKQRFGIAQALLGDPKLVIVDEPTAGLDPEERVRFHNLLGEIGEHIIVILSTHIVGDVSDLCRKMAVINKGQVVANGDPLELTRAFGGKVWEKFIDRKELPAHQDMFNVISSHLRAGRTLIRVFQESQPAPEFSPAVPDLEDVYFEAIRRHSYWQAQKATA